MHPTTAPAGTQPLPHHQTHAHRLEIYRHPWREILEQFPRRSPPVAMRVYLKHSHRFAEPHDELSFVAFEVSARESERTIFAYTPRESEIARQLANAVPIELNGSGRPPPRSLERSRHRNRLHRPLPLAPEEEIARSSFLSLLPCRIQARHPNSSPKGPLAFPLPSSAVFIP